MTTVVTTPVLIVRQARRTVRGMVAITKVTTILVIPIMGTTMVRIPITILSQYYGGVLANENTNKKG